MLFLHILSGILGIVQVSYQMSIISPFSETIPDPLSTVSSPYFDIPYPQHEGFFHKRNCVYSPHMYGSWMSPHHAMILHRLKHAQRNRLLQNLCRTGTSEHDQLTTRYCNVAKRICKDYKPRITKFKKHKKCTCKKEKNRNKHLFKRIRKMRKALNKEKLKLGNCMSLLDRERYSRLLSKSLMKYDVSKSVDKINTSRHELPVAKPPQNQRTRSKSCLNCTSHYTALKSPTYALHNTYDDAPRSISKKSSNRSLSLPMYKSSTYRSSYRPSNQFTKHYRHGKKYKHYNHKRKHKKRKSWRSWKRQDP